VLDPLELELYMAMGCRVCLLRLEPGSSAKTGSTFFFFWFFETGFLCIALAVLELTL
jgi:hypothetical protein